MDQRVERSAGSGGCLLRLGWMLLGNFVLALTAIWIVQNVHGLLSFSLADVIFWAAVVAMIAMRYADIRNGGQTSDNKPADMGHWWRYSLVLVPVAAGIWIVAHLI